MYSLFLLSKLFHSTMNLSHIFSTIFPDKETDDVLQKLSTKSILNSVKIIQTGLCDRSHATVEPISKP